MPVTDVVKDPANLTLTLTAQFDAPVERVWQVWADPRQLERWWGPPTYPATVVDHNLAVGGATSYFMTSPQGDKYNGWWRVRTVDAPHSLEFEEGFADGEGNPSPDMPVTVMRVTLAAQDGGTRMEVVSTFADTAAMERLMAMGMDEGLTASVGQIDPLLG
ncbi:MAG TPA: SRPBCC domain-containing protein [Pseudonocardia sp.]